MGLTPNKNTETSSSEKQSSKPQETSESLQKREENIRMIKSVQSLKSLPGHDSFCQFLDTASSEDVSRLTELIRILQSLPDGMAKLQNYFDADSIDGGVGFPNGKTVTISQVIEKFKSEIDAHKKNQNNEVEQKSTTEVQQNKAEVQQNKAEVQQTKTEVQQNKAEVQQNKAEEQKKAELEKQSEMERLQKEATCKSLLSDIRTWASQSFQRHFENATYKKWEEMVKLIGPNGEITNTDEFTKIIKENPQIIEEFRAELLAIAKKTSNYEAYKRVGTNLHSLGVINEIQLKKWIDDGREKPTTEPTKWLAPEGYQVCSDNILMKSDKGASMVIDKEKGTMKCVGDGGFVLTKHYGLQDQSKLYTEKLEVDATIANLERTNVTLGKVENLMNILSGDGVRAEMILPMIRELPTELQKIIEGQLRAQQNDLKRDLNREETTFTIAKILHAYVTGETNSLAEKTKEMIDETRPKLQEKIAKNADKLRVAKEKQKELSQTPQISEIMTAQETEEKMMADTVRFVEETGLNIFGTKADVERFLQILSRYPLNNERIKPDIGRGTEFMTPLAREQICKRLAQITENEKLYDYSTKPISVMEPRGDNLKAMKEKLKTTAPPLIEDGIINFTEIDTKIRQKSILDMRKKENEEREVYVPKIQ